MLKVTCAIIIYKNKILVTQLKAGSNRAFEWEFPGGKMNRGETAEECVIREIKEELNIEIEVQKQMFSIKYDNGSNVIELIPFLCTIKSGEIILNEHHKMTWETFENLKDLEFSAADAELILLEQNRELLKKYAGKNVHNPC